MGSSPAKQDDEFLFDKGKVNQPFDERSKVEYETRVKGHQEPLVTELYDIDQRDLKKIGTKKDIFLDTTVKRIKKEKQSINPMTGEDVEKPLGFGPDFPSGYQGRRQAHQHARKMNRAYYVHDGKKYNTITRIEQDEGIKPGSKQHLANMSSGKDYVDWSSKKKDSWRLKNK